MPFSQNGWSANDRSHIASFTIPGTNERIALRKDGPSVVLLDLLGFINHEVADLEQKTLDEWGYAERTIRGSSTTLSNHASGTAIDVNASKHSLGKSGTWSAKAVTQIEARLALYDGVVRWGRDYHGRKDEMHFELIKGHTEVVAVARKIRTGTLGHGAKSYLVDRAPFSKTDDTVETLSVTTTTKGKTKAAASGDKAATSKGGATVTATAHGVQANPYPEPSEPVERNDKAPDPDDGVKWVQWGIGFTKQDGFFGEKTETAVMAFQSAHGLKRDGVVGKNTKAELRKVTR
jgi:peptidoglycan hydrolase-like protein with peptidoglycan-binding domain